MSLRAKVILCTLLFATVGLLGGYVVLTWSVRGDALLFRRTGVRLLPVSVKGGPAGEVPDFLVAIDFEVENTHAIPIHIQEAHLLPKNPAVSGPVDPTLLVLTMASARNSYLGPLHPQTSGTQPHMDFPFSDPLPVPAHGVRRYSVVMSKEAAATFDPAKAHVLYMWRTATQDRVDKWIWRCSSLLPEKYQVLLKGLDYTMDITPITASPAESVFTSTTTGSP